MAYSASTRFDPVAQLPLPGGEMITALNVWKDMGDHCFAIGTNLGRMYVLRVGPLGELTFAGPLEFTKLPKEG